MARKSKAAADGKKIVAHNRRATHDYELHERLEVGVVLRGSEVKALRAGAAHLSEAYVQVQDGEAFLIGAHIAEYLQANRMNHPTERTRKLLLHRRQIDKLEVETRQKGQVAVPIMLYFNAEGRVKLEIGVGKGRATYDRRQAIKARDVQREVAREIGRRR